MDEIQTEPRTKVLKNGAVYDLDRKRIVANPGGGTTAITSERASELHARRQELKQQRIMAGAAKVLERSGDWETPGDLDVVEAIGEAIMENALNPDSRKQIDAARFILTESGLSSSRERSETPPTGVIVANPTALAELLELLDRHTAAAIERSRAVDVSATDIRNDVESD